MSKYTDEELAQRNRDKLVILELSQKIPAGHASWSYQQAVGFKAAVSNALKCANSAARTPQSMRTARAELEGFYK